MPNDRIQYFWMSAPVCDTDVHQFKFSSALWCVFTNRDRDRWNWVLW